MLGAVFSVAMGMILFGSAFIMFVNAMEDLKHDRVPHGMVPVVTVVAAIFGIIPALFPSEKTMYMMVAAGAAQTVVDNTQVNDVAREGMDVVKQFLVREKERLMNDSKK